MTDKIHAYSEALWIVRVKTCKIHEILLSWLYVINRDTSLRLFFYWGTMEFFSGQLKVLKNTLMHHHDHVHFMFFLHVFLRKES